MLEFQFIHNCVSHVCMMLFLLLFICRRYNRACTSAGMAAAGLLLIGLEYGHMVSAGWLASAAWYLFVQIAVTQGLVLLLSARRDWRALFTGLSGSNYALMGALVGQYAWEFTRNVWFSAGLVVVLNGGFLILLARFLRQSYLRLMNYDHGYWNIMCLIPALLYGCMYLVNVALQTSSDKLAAYLATLSTLFAIYLAYALLIYIMSKRSEEVRAARERDVLASGVQSLKLQIARMQKSELQIAIWEHDLRHYVRVLQRMMESGDYDGVTKLLDQQAGRCRAGVGCYCRNIPLNGVVSGYVDSARGQKIEIDVHMDLPEELQVDEWELAVVVSNLLDNAVRCCAQVPQPERRKIWIRAGRVRRQILLEVRNTFAGTVHFDQETGYPVSMRGQGHGIGMRSVQCFVESNQALCDCGVEQDVFYVRLLFSLDAE